MGKYQEASFILFSELDKLQLQVFGNDHPLAFKTKNNLANCKLEMGEYQDAFEIMSQVYKILTGSLGINHSTTLKTRDILANCMIKMGKNKKLLKYILKLKMFEWNL